MPFVSFISHMVQMKEHHPQSSWFHSDNFISHMVQMKEVKVKTQISFFVLYIPHGSDESVYYVKYLFEEESFISHMVQMKARDYSLGCAKSLYFISHMVQMKEKNS